MKTTIKYYFFSQCYERDYVKIMNVEIDLEHALFHTVHATHHKSYTRRSFWNEVQQTSLHCSQSDLQRFF